MVEISTQIFVYLAICLFGYFFTLRMVNDLRNGKKSITLENSIQLKLLLERVAVINNFQRKSGESSKLPEVPNCQ